MYIQMNIEITLYWNAKYIIHELFLQEFFNRMLLNYIKKLLCCLLKIPSQTLPKIRKCVTKYYICSLL